MKKKPDGKVIVERRSALEIHIAYGVTIIAVLGFILFLITKNPEYFGDGMSVFMFVLPFCLFYHALGNLFGREVGVYSRKCLYIKNKDATYTSHALKDIKTVNVSASDVYIILNDGKTSVIPFRGHPQAVHFMLFLKKHIPRTRKGAQKNGK